VIATFFARLWFRAKFLLLALAIVFYGLLLPGSWLAGVPVGAGLSMLLLRHVAKQNQHQSLPPTLASAIACYSLAAVPAFLALFVLGHISRVVRSGPAYEETVLGVALGFFLYPTWKLVRWGRAFHREARGSR